MTDKAKVIMLWIVVGLFVFAATSCAPEPRDLVRETSKVIEVLKCDSGRCIIKHSCGIAEVDSPIVEGTTIIKVLDTKYNRRWHAEYNVGYKYDKEIKCTTK